MRLALVLLGVLALPLSQVLYSESVAKLKPVQRRCKVRHETKARAKH
jgi:hypothetical protein